MKVLVYGNANADISVQSVEGLDPGVDTTFVDRISLSNGGNAMTAAMVLRRLGVPCSLAAWLGDESDRFSNFLLERLGEAGVDRSLIRRVGGGRCGAVIVLIGAAGRRFFLYQKGVQDQQVLEQAVLDRVPEFDVVSIHGTYLMPRFDGPGTKALLHRAKDCGKTTVMDVTPDTGGRWMETIRDALPWCDFFLPSLVEAAALTGESRVEDMAGRLLEAGCGTVVIKMGDKGCYYRSGLERGRLPAYPADAVDTTGAGDCFCGAFLCALGLYGSLVERLRFASAAAALSCRAVGAGAGVESVTQVERFLEEQKTGAP